MKYHLKGKSQGLSELEEADTAGRELVNKHESE